MGSNSAHLSSPSQLSPTNTPTPPLPHPPNQHQHHHHQQHHPHLHLHIHTHTHPKPDPLPLSLGTPNRPNSINPAINQPNQSINPINQTLPAQKIIGLQPARRPSAAALPGSTTITRAASHKCFSSSSRKALADGNSASARCGSNESRSDCSPCSISSCRACGEERGEGAVILPE